ncbi:hypothetical protein EDC01DRAFT_437086 [Geopyxis carbonaria]|nr:hypothetical protein EDC01DRAFT_437086 [Geopyxis carbonaria]
MAATFNASHVEYDGHAFNETLMHEFNYTIWDNGTLSNSSFCYLVFGRYEAYMLPNGSVINGTKCEAPVRPIHIRGSLGIAFGALYGLMIILALACLNKHGRMYLPAEKNFRLVSRRWPWYWMICAATCGIVSGMTSIDVDRNYLQGTALILQNIFYYVMLPAMLASIWEMTRHWGSMCERIMADEDPFRFHHDDRRAKIEFYTPLVFYLFGFLTFFLSVLRSWTSIPKAYANYAWAEKSSTDPRFRASSIFALLAFFVINFSVGVTWHYYPTVGRRIPPKIPICLCFIFVRIVYNIAVAWDYDIGPLKFDAPETYIYILGYLPVFGCMLAMVVGGWQQTNDDLMIKKLRRQRELDTDRDLGIRRGKELMQMPKTGV